MRYLGVSVAGLAFSLTPLGEAVRGLFHKLLRLRAGIDMTKTWPL